MEAGNSDLRPNPGKADSRKEEAGNIPSDTRPLREKAEPGK